MQKKYAETGFWYRPIENYLALKIDNDLAVRGMLAAGDSTDTFSSDTDYGFLERYQMFIEAPLSEELTLISMQRFYHDKKISATVDQQSISFIKPAFYYNYVTYLPLRPITEAMGLILRWHEATETATIALPGFDIKIEEPFRSYTGALYHFDSSPYVSGFLRDDMMYVDVEALTHVLSGTISWNDSRRHVTIYSSSYLMSEQIMPPEPDSTVDIVGPIEQDTTQFLFQLGILNDAELSKSLTAPLSLRDCFSLLARIDSYTDEDLRKELKKNNWSPEIEEQVCMTMRNAGVISSLDTDLYNLEKICTEADALKYVMRMLGDTDSCLQYKEETSYTEPDYFYQIALKKDVIDRADLTNANTVMSQEKFRRLVYRAVYAENLRGGYGGAHPMRYIDWLSD